MEFTGSPDMIDVVEKLKKRFADAEKALLTYLDDATNSGLADRRWMAIARTDLEKGFLAIEKALPAIDARRRNYAKVPVDPSGSQTYPVDPPVDPMGAAGATAPQPSIPPPVIEDYRADEDLTRP